jgi:hypothetical protein
MTEYDELMIKYFQHQNGWCSVHEKIMAYGIIITVVSAIAGFVFCLFVIGGGL